MDDPRPGSTSGQPDPAAAAAPSAGAHYRVAFDNSREAIVILQDGVVKVANPAAGRITELPPGKLLGRSFLEFVHPEDQEFLLDLYSRRLAGDTSERSSVARILRPGGGILVLEAHSMPVEWNGQPAVLVFLSDVTDREQVRSDALEMSRRLSRIAEVAPYFLFIYDYDLGRDIYINRSVPAALGYSPAEAAALGPYPFEHLCHPVDIAQALDRDARWKGYVDGNSRTVEFRLRHRNGEWRWFRSHNTPFLRDDKGRIQQILGMTQDVTESKRSEELLRRTERLESLGLLAGGIAHDFSNLLTPIVGNVELLIDRLPADSPLRDRALAISAAADRATELARQLLVYAGRGEIEPRAIDLNTLVEDVVHLLRALATIATSTRLDLAPRLPPVSGDSSQLRQVILNLVSNAHDAIAAPTLSATSSAAASSGSPGGTGTGDEPGRVLIRTRRVELTLADLGTLLLGDGMRPGPAVLLEVIDNGSGMEAETLERLWEPFFSTKERGRGLGLPSVLGILRAHRAGIALESHPSSGTQFRVYFSEISAKEPPGRPLPG
jgi:two-component system, cell cycle sensor histidine kinase and response regulator CckA